MQDEGHPPQAEGPQEISQKACASSQAQGRDHHAQEDSILQKVIPQVIGHVDCDIWYNYMCHRYKASVCLNGLKVQEISCL